LPGVGTINLAQLLAETGPIPDRATSAEQAASECGTAPVTHASGKTTGVYFRGASNVIKRRFCRRACSVRDEEAAGSNPATPTGKTCPLANLQKDAGGQTEEAAGSYPATPTSQNVSLSDLAE